MASRSKALRLEERRATRSKNSWRACRPAAEVVRLIANERSASKRGGRWKGCGRSRALEMCSDLEAALTVGGGAHREVLAPRWAPTAAQASPRASSSGYDGGEKEAGFNFLALRKPLKRLKWW